MMLHQTLKGWTQDISPYHKGEQEIQTRLGVREQMEKGGRRFIREYMPDQHRDFFQQLPFLMLGSVDEQGRPWASLVAGPQGFITSPDEVTLNISTRPLPGDPLNDNLRLNTDVGLLGIELENRRRNRMNGRITALDTDQFTVTVTQSFGNCPQYIQRRQLIWLPERLTAAPKEVQRFTQFTQPMKDLIATADTFFIATTYSEGEGSANQGTDVSHRGGKPGFVRVDGDRTFTFPDFAGNHFYNTLGNILLNHRAGALFLDFSTGHLLSITGHAEIIWDGEEVESFEGAQRLVRVTADEIVYLPEALPFRWDFQDYSPSLDFTGQWPVAVV